VNPPKVVIDHLTPEQRKFVILLALEVVYDLGADKVWSAFEKVEFSHMDEVVYSAFYSLLNSEQRSIITNLSRLSHDK
jgi:CRISPR/Cas system-associated endoribonuclease Cas2